MRPSPIKVTWSRLRGEYPVPLRVRLNRLHWSLSDNLRDAGLTAPEQICRNTDLPYGRCGQWNLLDLYRPADSSGALPVIVSVHGGGYFYGSKERYQFYCMDLARRGFAVINFNYRLAPEFRFPAPLEDLNQVLYWLLRNAEAYCLNPEQLFLVGDSAGAQIVSQYAAAWADPSYARLLGLTLPALSLSGVGLNCGLYQIDQRAKSGSLAPLARDYLGPEFDLNDPRLDVTGHINSRYPPTYLLSAPNDFLASQCQPMAELLASHGVPVRWKLYGTPERKQVGHVFHINLRLPEGRQANDEELAFFRAQL